MPNIIPASYRKSVTEIASLYLGARKTLVETYWKIGRRIVEVEQDGSARARYGAGLLKQFSRDLSKKCGPGFSVENLRIMRRFYLSQKRLAPTELTWAQQVELLRVEDLTHRNRLTARAAKEQIPSRELRRLVRAENKRSDKGAVKKITKLKPLIPQKGRPYVYRLVQMEKLNLGKTGLWIDLGFSNYREAWMPGIESLKPGDIASSEWIQKDEYRLTRVTESSAESLLFTYFAYVERVVDGDTLLVQVDLGFGQWTRQYLRLRGIDAPELVTPEGKRAKAFFEQLFRAAYSVPCTASNTQNAVRTTQDTVLAPMSLLIHTTRSDKYDRYLADVFMKGPEGHEQYLNQLLINAGHAVRVQE